MQGPNQVFRLPRAAPRVCLMSFQSKKDAPLSMRSIESCLDTPTLETYRVDCLSMPQSAPAARSDVAAAITLQSSNPIFQIQGLTESDLEHQSQSIVLHHKADAGSRPAVSVALCNLVAGLDAFPTFRKWRAGGSGRNYNRISPRSSKIYT